MSENLHQMTHAELKQYLSQHRNEEEAFREALQVLISRRNSETVRYPYPFDVANPEREITAILKKKLNQTDS
ncbi:DUF6887 family protein [Laspinema olomoucense]|uniref:DUF6887 family protein n=1 Tax=Laspinema olomoucense TaxID=3231600 RepID=UPI0021BB631D|nr:hypothetical protein [Laspinema sp. D3a]MCT7990317.1 hypothetical protein [Laspinema sp. D3a]